MPSRKYRIWHACTNGIAVAVLATRDAAIMTRDVITVSPAAPIHEAARLMVEHGVSGLPVIDANGRLVGIISEGDLILRQRRRKKAGWWHSFVTNGKQIIRKYRRADGRTVGDVMT